MGMKEKLIHLIQEVHQEEQAVMALFSTTERTATGSAQAWSLKDLIAHVIVWQDRMIDGFELAARGEPRPTYGPDDDENLKIFEANQHKSWDAIGQMIDASNARLLDYVRAVREEDLTDPARSVLKNERPLWHNITGTTASHALLHLAQYCANHGQAAYATPMQERIAERLIALDATPSWRAGAIYNLACYYALAGLKAPAITRLGEALKLEPGLTEWSTKDADLTAIRDEAGYKALYA